MTRLFVLLVVIVLLASCRSTKKIQSAITKKDTAVTVTDVKKNDTTILILSTLQKLKANQINYRSFTAKINVDYRGGDGKNYDVNANVRLIRDSAIWISANAILGIEAMRVLITRDSVKLLNKLEKTYTARSVDYLQQLTALPLDLETLQNLIVGNPVFLDTNVVSYSIGNNGITMLSIGEFFKNLITLSETDHTILHSKLDDADISRNRTANLTYTDYENKKGFPFATKRRITVAEKKTLDIRLDYKQYDFNEDVSFPFSVPRNYELN